MDKARKIQSRRQVVHKRIQEYFQVLTRGCGRQRCTNPNCASNPQSDRIFGNEAAVKAIQLLLQKAGLCPSDTNIISCDKSASTDSYDNDNGVDTDCNLTGQASCPIPTACSEVCRNRLLPHQVWKRSLKDYYAKDVEYLTEEMIDNLILICHGEGNSMDKDRMLGSKINPKDPYRSLFLAITEVFSEVNCLNKSFLKMKTADPQVRCKMEVEDHNCEMAPGKICETSFVLSSLTGYNHSLTSSLKSYLEDSSHELNDSYKVQQGNALSKQWDKLKLQMPLLRVSEPTVDIESVRRVYEKLLSIRGANEALVNSLELLSIGIDAQVNSVKLIPCALDLNVFVIIMENPYLHSPEYLTSCLPKFCKVMADLPDEAKLVLVNYWSKFGKDRLRTFVQCMQQLITYEVLSAKLSQDEEIELLDLHKNATVANAVRCLKLFYYSSLIGGKINKKSSNYNSKLVAEELDFPPSTFDFDEKTWKDTFAESLDLSGTSILEPLLPPDEFQNEILNEVLNVSNDYTNSATEDMNANEFTFMKYPFVLSTLNKATYFVYNNKVQMLSGRRLMILQSILSHTIVSPYLHLKIRRDHVIEDALVQLELIAGDNPVELRKQLYVEFVGEQGVDEGGVSKEFFQLVVEQIFNPDYGMFTYDNDTRLFWFNPHSFENTAQYSLIGIVLGLAIYNSCILDIKLPTAVYKKLMGENVTYKDTKDLYPVVHKGLEQLLCYEGNVAADIMAVFCVEYHDMFDQARKHELRFNGENIPVTNENRKEYVQLYSNWLLNESIGIQFEAFRHGFNLVVAKSPLKYLFRSDELEILISGSQEYDFKSLETVCEYDGGFTTNSVTIKHFWDVVHKMSIDDKKKLLQFVTGTDRAPVGGLAQLKLVIARNGPYSNRLPTAHTCFNILLMPDYNDRDKLKERLYKAITFAKGFGML